VQRAQTSSRSGFGRPSRSASAAEQITDTAPLATSSIADDDFAFDPDGIFWHVCRERCSLLDGGAAAVLQVAHPKIAAGVRDHSDFREGPVGRLKRTLDGVNAIAFGTRREAEAMARRIARRHGGVRGDVGRSGAAESYDASEPELLLWVVATLVMAAVNGFERGVRRLSGEELEAFYVEMRRFGTYFGLGAEVGPQTWEAFQGYYTDMLNQPWMGSTQVSREMAWAVAAPSRPWWLRLASRPLRFTFSEIIPEPVCGRLGFRRTSWSRFCIRVTTAVMPWVVRLLPARLRFAPQYIRARERITASPPM
jgi:uncharacterized protein (DUF2236 family)